MNKIKKLFADLKQTTPVHIQWLLLFAAFLVVVILLILLLSGRTTTADSAGTTVAALEFNPNEIEWRNIETGERLSQVIQVRASVPTLITSIRLSENISGLSHVDTCRAMGAISSDIACTITLTFNADATMPITGTQLQVVFHAANVPADMANMATMPIVISVAAPYVPAPPPPAFFEPEIDTSWPEPEPIVWPEPEPVITPAPLPPPPPPAPAPPARQHCRDFEVAGFDLNGQQSGWIRPQAGRFFLFGFGDDYCDNAIGEYNIDSGIIYSFTNPPLMIGSSAEHLNRRQVGMRGEVPSLQRAPGARQVNRAQQLPTHQLGPANGGMGRLAVPAGDRNRFIPSSRNHAVVSSRPYDRTFVLRQFKPIPATIVSEVRADADIDRRTRLPVIATVDRNVFADNGRTIIIPTGTQLMGYVTGELPGPYRRIGRMSIHWYRFVLPNGVEFNFTDAGTRPFSGDSQGRTGVPGRGSTDYMESMIMPMLTAAVPAMVNLVAPISDRFVNQINLDNNTVTQTGTIRSSELAKQEIISTWNRVAQRMVLDALDNTTPPFSIAAGTRITVFSPRDLIVTCDMGDPNDSRDCAVMPASEDYAHFIGGHEMGNLRLSGDIAEWIGQVRAMDALTQGICAVDQNGNFTGQVRTTDPAELRRHGINDFRTAQFFCQSQQFQARNVAQWNQFMHQQQQVGQQNVIGTFQGPTGQGAIFTPDFQQNHLGMQVNPDTGLLVNPFAPTPSAPAAPAVPSGPLCEDGTSPDFSGCCTGETLTDMQEMGWNCCPAGGGDCFPPLF
ncbi:MAG: hypothetical protein FWC83_00990 [Alphaproteobacteria bacterium]|nr:hypothetical protein [Alphaproteobacteria bacterium]